MSFSTAIAKALVVGDSIIVREGVYRFNSMQAISKSGSLAKFIHIIAYSDEIPVLDFRTQAYNSSSHGVKVSGSYVHVKGLNVQDAGDNGMQVTVCYSAIGNKIVLKGDVENIDIYNMIGKKVYLAPKLTTNSIISTVQWTKGVYVVVVNSGSKLSFSQKLLLQ